jgi:hypothetical protein
MKIDRVSFVMMAFVVGLAPTVLASPLFLGSVADPAGDASGGPDILFADVLVDASSIRFIMEFAPGTLDPATTLSGFSLDADRDSTTGIPWNGIGVEFVVSQGYLGDTGTAYLFQDGLGNIASSPVSFFTDRVEYAFALALFGAEDGLLDFIATTQIALSPSTSTTIRDFAPDIGLGPASTVAAAPEPSILMLLAAGGLSLWVGRRPRAR